MALTDAWAYRNSPLFGWQNICWSPELSLFVAVANSGTGNRVMTSPDGITWTLRASAADNNWYGLCWSPELLLFVAVANSGTGNRVMTSPDGITWTIRASAADNSWKSVCWSPELSLFVAVADSGTGNRVMTSPDGITWTIRTSAANYYWQEVCWSPELSLFVAVADSGTGNRVMTSPNGIIWTARSSAADHEWHRVFWAEEISLFVAISRSGSAMYSKNGIDWALASALPNSWRGLSWAPKLSLFVAVSIDGTNNRVMTWSFGKLALIIDENLAAINFKARAVTVGSGETIGTADGQSPGFTLPTLDARACNVIVLPDIGDRWYPSTVYALDEKAFPTDPVSTPYYYKRLVAGTSGSTEPAWPTTPGGRCDDGGVTEAWELVERLVQPVTHGPLIPG